jgi:hypothetical protein
MVGNVRFAKRKLLNRKPGVTETSIAQKSFVRFVILNCGHPFNLNFSIELWTLVICIFFVFYIRVNVRGFLHFLHVKLFSFKERSLYDVTRPQLLHLANFSSFPSLCLIEWFNERNGLSGLFEGNFILHP